MKGKIKAIVENNDTKSGKVFDLTIQFFILISILSFSLETLPTLPAATRAILKYVEVITVIIFTIEYLLRVAVTDQKTKFIFSFFGIIDLAAILPFYLAVGIDLRSLRALRMLRIFRIFKLARYSQAIQRFHRAFVLVKEELVLFFCTACILIYLSAAGIYYFENQAQPETFQSVFHSLWWAVATLTTVGYGDVYPVTGGGKLFTFFVLMVGLGIIAVPAGLLASSLSKAREEQEEEPRKDQQQSMEICEEEALIAAKE